MSSILCCAGGQFRLVPPASPGCGGGDERVAWYDAYPELLAKYYELGDKFVSGDWVRGVSGCSGDFRCGGSSTYLSGALGSRCGSGGDDGSSTCGSCGAERRVGFGVENGEDADKKSSCGCGQCGVCSKLGIGCTERTSIDEVCGVELGTARCEYGLRNELGSGERPSSAVEVAGGKLADGSLADLAGVKVVQSHLGVSESLGASGERGKNWWSNQKKAKKRKMAGKNWRQGARPLVDGSGGCVSSESDCGSVVTLGVRTAVEVEASQTLAARRVAENKYEIARLQAKTRSFDDKSKTEALGRLEAARMEQRINQAIARSQKAYSETDRSLKSLGSTGSAGEFALKKEVKRGEEARIERDYLKAQIGKVMRYAPASVREEIANMKPPVFPTDEEVFGDCPEEWSDAEKMDYYDEQERHDEELAEKSVDHRIVREPENVVFDSTLLEDMRRLRDLTVFE